MDEQTSDLALACLVCGCTLANAMPGLVRNQPLDGVIATTGGNYGSTVFDSFDGSVLEFNVCDSCLTRAGVQGRVLIGRNERPVEAENCGVVGWEAVDEPQQPWREGVELPPSRRYLTADDDLEALPVTVRLRFTPAEIQDLMDDPPVLY